MKKEEMIKRIEELEKEIFLLEMKDRWSEKDFDYKRRMFNEVLELRKKVEEMEA